MGHPAGLHQRRQGTGTALFHLGAAGTGSVF